MPLYLTVGRTIFIMHKKPILRRSSTSVSKKERKNSPVIKKERRAVYNCSSFSSNFIKFMQRDKSELNKRILGYPSALSLKRGGGCERTVSIFLWKTLGHEYSASKLSKNIRTEIHILFIVAL